MKLILIACGSFLLIAFSVGAQTPSNTVAVRVDDCGCESQPPLPAVLASVNGVKITSAELVVNERIKQIQREVVDARKREVDLQINSLLLNAEAKRLGTTTTKLLEREVLAKTKPITEAEAQAFYEQNKAQIRSEFASVKNDILAYLKLERERDAGQAFAAQLRSKATVTLPTRGVTAPTNKQDLSRVFATVNGTHITSADVEESLRPLIFSVQERVYTLRKDEVDRKINDVLLQQEAAKRGIPINALLEAEVRSKLAAVTDAEAEKFYNENKERINGDFPSVKPQIVEFLAEQRARAQQGAFAERLRANAKIQIFLNAPEPPTYNIAIDDQPVRGNPNAKTTMVIFTDLQCPSCAELHLILERLIASYGNRVKFVIRDYPLNQHKDAELAAIAAEAAREQGKYWEYVAILYRNQSALEKEKLKEYASQLNLDRTKFDQDLVSERLRDKVERDRVDGSRIGVNTTPTIFLNGRRVSERSYEVLVAVLNASLTNN